MKYIIIIALIISIACNGYLLGTREVTKITEVVRLCWLYKAYVVCIDIEK